MKTIIIVLLILWIVLPYVSAMVASYTLAKKFDKKASDIESIVTKKCETWNENGESKAEIIGVKVTHPTDTKLNTYIPVKNNRSIVDYKVRKDLLTKPINQN